MGSSHWFYLVSAHQHPSPSLAYLFLSGELFGAVSFLPGSSAAWLGWYQRSLVLIFAMSCISLLGSVVWGHHMYTVGLETDTRAYFSGVTILISLPTATKIFNWLSTYLLFPILLNRHISVSFCLQEFSVFSQLIGFQECWILSIIVCLLVLSFSQLISYLHLSLC